MSNKWLCEEYGHVWNLAAEKCTVCGIPVSSITLPSEQQIEFDNLNDTVKTDEYETILTLRLKTYGTPEQAAQTLERFKSEVALQHFDVDYYTEYTRLRDSNKIETFDVIDITSSNDVRTIMDLQPKEPAHINPNKFTLLGDSINEIVDEFEISKRKYMSTDDVLTGAYFVTDLTTGLSLSYVTHDLGLFDRLQPRRQHGNALCWLQIIDSVRGLGGDRRARDGDHGGTRRRVVQSTFKVV